MFTKQAVESKLTPKQAFKLGILEQCVRAADSTPHSAYYTASNSLMEGMQNPTRVELLDVDRKIRGLGIEEGLAPINQIYAHAMAATQEPHNEVTPKRRREEFKRQFKGFIRDNKLAPDSFSDAEIDYVFSRINCRSFSYQYFINASKPLFGLHTIPNFRDIFLTELAESFGGNRATAGARLDEFDAALKDIPITEMVKKGQEAYAESWIDSSQAKLAAALQKPPYNISTETFQSEVFQRFFKEVIRTAFVEPEAPKKTFFKHLLGSNEIDYCETPALASARKNIEESVSVDQRRAIEQLLRGAIANTLESMASPQPSHRK